MINRLGFISRDRELVKPLCALLHSKQFSDVPSEIGANYLLSRRRRCISAGRRKFWHKLEFSSRKAIERGDLERATIERPEGLSGIGCSRSPRWIGEDRRDVLLAGQTGLLTDPKAAVLAANDG